MGRARSIPTKAVGTIRGGYTYFLDFEYQFRTKQGFLALLLVHFDATVPSPNWGGQSHPRCLEEGALSRGRDSARSSNFESWASEAQKQFRRRSTAAGSHPRQSSSSDMERTRSRPANPFPRSKIAVSIEEFSVYSIQAFRPVAPSTKIKPDAGSGPLRSTPCFRRKSFSIADSRVCVAGSVGTETAISRALVFVLMIHAYRSTCPIRRNCSKSRTGSDCSCDRVSPGQVLLRLSGM